ncbi:PREDICTED: uncharacterized protein LOC105146156 [Acromyrmex echinatior]|uniref:uncharacterized protein LOC105146156 n=1 Tax=Acromyrmex echinatior TaxID=103372 RepID=UPI000580E417|nr:PREDICTED: uncharacterized protein LOC105146156 [Acromyrmex echinatior]
MYSETLRWYSKNGHGGRCVLRLLTFTKDFLNNGITITGSTTLFKRNKKGISVFYWLQERIVMPVPWRHPWCIEERALSKRLAVQLLNKIFRFGCEPSCPDVFLHLHYHLSFIVFCVLFVNKRFLFSLLHSCSLFPRFGNG